MTNKQVMQICAWDGCKRQSIASAEKKTYEKVKFRN
jgi:hypothetical protein